MILVALGGNVAGAKGQPLQSLTWALNEMPKFHMRVNIISPYYTTSAVGQTGQPDYVNAVALIHSAMPVENVLRNLKRIEIIAGRNNKKLKTAGRWGARPLDLDIVDYKGRIFGNYKVCNGDNHVTSGERTVENSLFLPHPRAHERAFVIRPIVDILPFWHHPILGVSALSLWSRLQHRPEGRILNRIAPAPAS